MRCSPLSGRYDKPFDRESAYEILSARAEQAAADQAAQPPINSKATKSGSLAEVAGSAVTDFAGKVMQTTIRQAVNRISNQIVRGILGSLTGGKKRR